MPRARQAMLEDVAVPDDSPLRRRIREAHLAPEAETVHECIALAGLSAAVRSRIRERARELVGHIRGAARRYGLMESFLNEYGLTNEEGIALMCLAEAMLRVPDTHTLDALIQDKIGPANWRRHLGHSESTFVNASSWGLMLAGGIVREDDDAALRGQIRAVVRKLGEPVIRVAVAKAMALLAEEFVLGREIDEALANARPLEERGYRFSYDMLGEAAITAADAERYLRSYRRAIAAIADKATAGTPAANPGISVKLSALHPRYEFSQRRRVMGELMDRVAELARAAKGAQLGFNIDAEEADRLELSLDVIEALSGMPELQGWDGLGVVVQAYQKRAPFVLDWLAELARRHGRRFMLRLVKGAYWDSEIKWHQERGLEGYPVFTRKPSTDICFLACATKLLGRAEAFYPQFATHNALSVASVLELAGGNRDFEFQRLQGMGEALHERLVAHEGFASRIYAPVGVHKDLLAYLVRRLLENGANSSFVNQLVDDSVPVEELIADPIDEVMAQASIAHEKIPLPPGIFGPERRNSRGRDLADPAALRELRRELAPYEDRRWGAGPLIAGHDSRGTAVEVRNPARPSDLVGSVIEATEADVDRALDQAAAAFAQAPAWSVVARAAALRRAADSYEAASAELIALCLREAGKTYADAIAEVREAVDFLRYYAVRAEALAVEAERGALGVYVCISPWNFPLAIFTGQAAAALAVGNAVIAKPAEETPLIAHRAVELLHAAGIPAASLQFVPGPGERVGQRLVSDARIAGVAFTGSTATARAIRRAMVEAGNADARLVAETGGVNAMIVDSTALPEQAVKDIVTSAFQSAGQRCSALRLLYVQDDIAEELLEMLAGAMAELVVGDPVRLATDVGPLITETAKREIGRHVERMKREARLIHECRLGADLASGHFLPPVAFELERPEQLTGEVFGPVLHVVRFAAEDLDGVLDAINASGYGLTLGLHSRIDATVEHVTGRARVGNIYVNRNQIGAVVGAHPFGGEGLSGTGPKAGGPNYLLAFTGKAKRATTEGADLPDVDAPVAALADEARALQASWDRRHDRYQVIEALARVLADRGYAAELVTAVSAAAAWARESCAAPLLLPGPTGERNQLALHGRGVFLCLGDGGGEQEAAIRQCAWALAAGNAVVARLDSENARCFVAAGVPSRLLQCLPETPWPARLAPERLAGVDGAALEADGAPLGALARAAAALDGPVLPIVSAPDRYFAFAVERTLSINTTASGGNASLLAMTS